MKFLGLILILLIGVLFKCISCFPEHRKKDLFDDSEYDLEDLKHIRKREVNNRQEFVARLKEMLAESTRMDTDESGVGKKSPFNSMHFQGDNNFFTFINTVDNVEFLEFMFHKYFSDAHRPVNSSMNNTFNKSMTQFNKETTELRHDLLREVKRMEDSKEKEPEFKDASMQVKSLIERMGALMDNFTSHVTQYVSKVQSDMKTIQGVCHTSSTKNEVNPKPASCDDVDKSGVHTIYPDFKPSGLEVYCDIDQGKAWLVIQRRKFGTVDFDRHWEEYKTGFGNLSGDFWLGNEYIYHLTKYKSRQLHIDMETFEGKKAFAVYSEFGVSSEAGKYKLSVKGYSGDADDNLIQHNGQMFSTYDADNDSDGGRCCACIYRGGWWFYACYASHLNGKYYYKHETVLSSPLWGQFVVAEICGHEDTLNSSCYIDMFFNMHHNLKKNITI